MALDPSMAAAPVFSGASGPVLVAPPRLRSSVLVGFGVEEVRVNVAEVRVALLVLLREIGSPVP